MSGGFYTIERDEHKALKGIQIGLWAELNYKAAHAPHTVKWGEGRNRRDFPLQVGETITSIRYLAERLDSTRDKVSTALVKFEERGLILTSPRKDGTLITVPNVVARVALIKAAAEGKKPAKKPAKTRHPNRQPNRHPIRHLAVAGSPEHQGVPISSNEESATLSATQSATQSARENQEREPSIENQDLITPPSYAPALEDELVVIEAAPAPPPAEQGGGIEDDFLKALSYATQGLNLVPGDTELLKFESSYRIGGFTAERVKALVEEIKAHAILSAETRSINRIFTLPQARKDTRERAGKAAGIADEMRRAGKGSAEAFAALYESALVPHNADKAKRKEHCAFLVWYCFQEDIFNYGFESMQTDERMRKYA